MPRRTSTPSTFPRRAVLAACLVLASCLALTAVAAGAQTLTLDFETLPGPDGMLGTGDDLPFPDCPGSPCPLDDQYATVGVRFTLGSVLQDDLFPGTTAENHFLTSSPPDATLDLDVYAITIRSYSLWNAVLYALDGAGNVLAVDTLPNPDAGGSFHLGTLAVTSTSPIERFTVRPEGCAIDQQCSRILNLDELTLVTEPGTCVETESVTCLQQERFAVEVDWMDFMGQNDRAKVVPFGSDDSGLFWFFEPDNWEMLVKVLDGCGVNGHFWVFAAATTNVEYTLRVTDTETGEMRDYTNPLGNAADALTDTSGFDTCP